MSTWSRDYPFDAAVAARDGRLLPCADAPHISDGVPVVPGPRAHGLAVSLPAGAARALAGRRRHGSDPWRRLSGSALEWGSGGGRGSRAGAAELRRALLALRGSGDRNARPDPARAPGTGMPGSRGARGSEERRGGGARNRLVAGSLDRPS